MKIKKNKNLQKIETGTELGIVIGFFASLLLENPLWILIGIIAGSGYDMITKRTRDF